MWQLKKLHRHRPAPQNSISAGHILSQIFQLVPKFLIAFVRRRGKKLGRKLEELSQKVPSFDFLSDVEKNAKTIDFLEGELNINLNKDSKDLSFHLSTKSAHMRTI
jgi:hypothetical protein